MLFAAASRRRNGRVVFDVALATSPANLVTSLPNIKGWDNTGEVREPFPGQTGSIHFIKTNPGDYELKVLWKNHLTRSIKFTVSADGKFDNGIAAANKLGSNRVILPVQIIGDQDGTWGQAGVEDRRVLWQSVHRLHAGAVELGK